MRKGGKWRRGGRKGGWVAVGYGSEVMKRRCGGSYRC